jgi:hypothetical protein
MFPRFFKMLKKFWLWILGVLALLRFLLDNWSRIQELRDFFDHRGTIMKWIGLVLISQWLPLGLFLIGVAVLLGIHLDLFSSKKEKKDGLMQPTEPKAETPSPRPPLSANTHPYAPPPSRFTGVEVVPPRDSPLNQLREATSIIDIIGRRVTDLAEKIDRNLEVLELVNRTGARIDKTRPNLKRLEPIEQELVDRSKRVDREMSWPEFHKLGVAVADLNSLISDFHSSPEIDLCHLLLKRIEDIRKHIVVIQSEKANHVS